MSDSDARGDSRGRPDGGAGRDGRVAEGGDERVTLAVAAVVALALVARLALLGDRPFHWSEGRVGYWSLRFLETGVYEYRPVAGGPLPYLLARWTFGLVGTSDALARFPVAFVGGVLPAAALLFRGRLRGDETVALALLLAGSPLLVYYSRFLRGDVLAAAFGLVAVGGVVRYRDAVAAARAARGVRADGTGADGASADGGGPGGDDPAARRGRSDSAARWPLYLAAAAFALALGSSGYAVAYLPLWLVSGALVLDEARVRGVPRAAVARVGAGVGWTRGNATPLARALLVFLVVAFLLFAPRGGGAGPGLWDLATLPAAARFAFVEAPERFVSVRMAARLAPRYPDGNPFVPAVVGYARTLLATAWPAVVFGVVGFLAERYRADTRAVVAFGGYAAGFGLLGFPIASMTVAPWSAVHVVPLLALPGAVGLALAVRALRTRATAADPAWVVAALLVAAAGVAGYGAAVAGVYAAPEAGSPYAQFAQPSSDLDPMLSAAAAAAEGNDDGPDVVYVGDRLATEREYPLPPVEAADRDAWGARLPLQWYFERMGAEAASAGSVGQLAATPPPVVVTTPDRRVAVNTNLEGYRQFDAKLGLWNRDVVVFVRTS